MSNSFYGGKKGFNFYLVENQREGSSGIWTAVGTPEDTAEQDTLYAGIKRGNLKYGDYAAVEIENDICIYRMILNNLLKVVPKKVSQVQLFGGADGAPGHAAHWFSGTELTHNSGTVTYEIDTQETVYSGDMYLNTTSGNVYCCLGENQWEYEQNIKGPAGDPGSMFVIETQHEEGASVQQVFKFEDVGMMAVSPIVQDITHQKITAYSDNTNIFPIDVSPTDVVGDASNTPRGAYIWYYKIADSTGQSVFQKYPNSIHLYSGDVLPPLIGIPSGISVFRRRINNGTITWEKMPEGYYIILSDGSLINLYLSSTSSTTDFLFCGFGLLFSISSHQALSSMQMRSIRCGYTENGNYVYPQKPKTSLGQWTISSQFYYPPDSGAQKQSFSAAGFANLWEVIREIIRNAPAILTVDGEESENE